VALEFYSQHRKNKIVSSTQSSCNGDSRETTKDSHNVFMELHLTLVKFMYYGSYFPCNISEERQSKEQNNWL